MKDALAKALGPGLVLAAARGEGSHGGAVPRGVAAPLAVAQQAHAALGVAVWRSKRAARVSQEVKS